MNAQSETTAPESTGDEKVERKLSGSTKTEFDNLPTKSAKIRYLAAKGWKRGDIAKFLDIRYQHVRNVLVMPVKNPKS